MKVPLLPRLFISPPPIVAAQSDKDVDIQFAATRATIPSIDAASARLHAAMRTDANRTASSTLSSASSLADNITNLSRLVWGVFELRAMQMMAMLALYHHEQAAVFDRTGGG